MVVGVRRLHHWMFYPKILWGIIWMGHCYCAYCVWWFPAATGRSLNASLRFIDLGCSLEVEMSEKFEACLGRVGFFHENPAILQQSFKVLYREEYICVKLFCRTMVLENKTAATRKKTPTNKIIFISAMAALWTANGLFCFAGLVCRKWLYPVADKEYMSGPWKGEEEGGKIYVCRITDAGRCKCCAVSSCIMCESISDLKKQQTQCNLLLWFSHLLSDLLVMDVQLCHLCPREVLCGSSWWFSLAEKILRNISKLLWRNLCLIVTAHTALSSCYWKVTFVDEFY